MFWAFLLLALCVACAFRHTKAAVIFAIPLLLAMSVTYFGANHPHVWLFSIYAGIGSITFFLVDWKAGGLVVVVSLASAAHAFGFIDALHRDIAGEALFVFGLLAATFSNPSRGAANILFGPFSLHGHSSGAGNAAGLDRFS